MTWLVILDAITSLYLSLIKDHLAEVKGTIHTHTKKTKQQMFEKDACQKPKASEAEAGGSEV